MSQTITLTDIIPGTKVQYNKQYTEKRKDKHTHRLKLILLPHGI